jgi:mannose-6-phosphate isomerase-like protein (cupin superfamily)
MTCPLAPALFSLAAAQALRQESLRQSVSLLRHGTLDLRLYRPPMPDPQQPHKRDELYVVAMGNGVFNRAGERFPCTTGDVLFVAAGVEHRFEEATPGFAVWVMFWGPDGGEAPS